MRNRRLIKEPLNDTGCEKELQLSRGLKRFMHGSSVEGGVMGVVLNSIPIEKGKANKGIVKHLMQDEDGNNCFVMIEKRLGKSGAAAREFACYKSIESIGALAVKSNVLPEIYSAFSSKRGYSVFMKHYENVGGMLEDKVLHGRLLARAIYELNRQRIVIPRIHSMVALEKRMWSGDLFLENQPKMKGCLSELSEKRRALGRNGAVTSHNDAATPNMALEKSLRGSRLVFIDFGHCAYNEMGGDFHYLARARYKKSRVSGLFGPAIEEYSALTKTDQSVLSFNAHYFAFLRVLDNCRAKEKSGIDISQDLTFAEKLVGGCFDSI